jgi:hypothetical protein
MMKQASPQERQIVVAALQAEEMLKSASPQEIEGMKKLAALHAKNRGTLKTEEEKRAYAAGMEDAAVMTDMAEETGEMPAETAPEPSIEEIVVILDQLVQAGAIDPAMAEQIVMMLAEGGGAGGAEGAPVDPAAEEAAMAEAMAAEGGAPAEEGMIAEASTTEDKIKAATAALK